MKHQAPLALASFALAVNFTGCLSVKTEPIRVEPIRIEPIEINVTINHRIQKELSDIFAGVDAASTTTKAAPAVIEPIK